MSNEIIDRERQPATLDNTPILEVVRLYEFEALEKRVAQLESAKTVDQLAERHKRDEIERLTAGLEIISEGPDPGSASYARRILEGADPR